LFLAPICVARLRIATLLVIIEAARRENDRRANYNRYFKRGRRNLLGIQNG